MNKILRKNILLIIILIVGAAVRFYRLAEYINFLGDEGRDAIVAYNIAHGHLTLLGPTSSVGGFFLGPNLLLFYGPFSLVVQL